MLAMEEFYPDEYSEFRAMVEKQEISIPEGICANLTDSQYEQLYKATIIHEKPLTNALGIILKYPFKRKSHWNIQKM